VLDAERQNWERFSTIDSANSATGLAFLTALRTPGISTRPEATVSIAGSVALRPPSRVLGASLEPHSRAARRASTGCKRDTDSWRAKVLGAHRETDRLAARNVPLKARYEGRALAARRALGRAQVRVQPARAADIAAARRAAPPRPVR
jgi:hypothetical protein